MKIILSLCLLLASAFSKNAQVTDSVFVLLLVEPSLYYTLPNATMLTAKGEEVDYLSRGSWNTKYIYLFRLICDEHRSRSYRTL